MDNLTPEASALRAFTVLTLDKGDAGNVLRFFGAARLLRGCDWTLDERARYAQSLILKWVGLSLQCSERDETEDAALRNPTLREAAHDAAILAYWLSSIEPIESDSFERGDGVSLGHQRVSELIDNLLTAALGNTAPDSDPSQEVAHG